MNNLLAFVIAAAVLLFFMSRYLKDMKKQAAQARAAAEKGKLRSDGPNAQHPHIETEYCIGCAACTAVCPEGDVLAMLGGKAAIVNGYKCIGHSLCADVCPVGAITMVMANPSMSADMPRITSEYETSIQNLFIAGELGGLALIKNAIARAEAASTQSRSRIGPSRTGAAASDVLRGADCWSWTRGNQRFASRNREEAEPHHAGRRRNRRNGGEVSAPETRHDQPRGISDVWEIQEDRTFEGRAHHVLEQSARARRFQFPSRARRSKTFERETTASSR